MTTRFGYGGADYKKDAALRGVKRTQVIDSTLPVAGDNSSSLIEDGFGPVMSFKRLKGLAGLDVTDTQDFVSVSGLPLQNAIAVEAALREQGQNIVSDLVYGEIGRAQAAEAGLSQLIQQETVRAQAAEQQITTDLSAEAFARQNEDTLLRNRINTAESDLLARIVQESADRSNTDAWLDSRINTEQARAVLEESKLQTQISNLLSNTDAVALNSLAELVADYKQNGATIDARLTSYQTTNDLKVDGVASDLAAEAARAIAVENELAGTVSTLQQTVNFDVSRLDTRVETLETSVRNILDYEGLKSDYLINHELFYTDVDNKIFPQFDVYTSPSSTDIPKAKLRVFRNLGDGKITLQVQPFEFYLDVKTAVHGIRIGQGHFTHTRLNAPRYREGEELNQTFSWMFALSPQVFWPSPNAADDFVLLQSAFLSLRDETGTAQVVPASMYISSDGEILIKRDNLPLPKKGYIGFATRQEFSYFPYTQ